MATELTDLDVDDVSLVRRGAIQKKFNVLKSDDDRLTVGRAVADALDEPVENEAQLVDHLRKCQVDSDAQEALIAALRLTKAFESALPENVNAAAAALMKAAKPTDGTNGDEPDDEVAKRSFTVAQRRELAAAGKALPDGSYPIAAREDLGPAIALARSGHGDVAAAKALIVRRAKELDATGMLPDDWQVAKASGLEARVLERVQKMLEVSA